MREVYQRKAGGTWWCDYYDADGRRVRRSTRCKDRRAAELCSRRFEREAHDPNHRAEDPASPPVKDILAHFVNYGCPAVADATLSMYLTKSAHLQRLIGDHPVTDLQTTAVMQGYIAARLAEGAAHGTIYKELVTMRQALHAGLEAKLLSFDPRIAFPRFKARYQPKARWLTPDEARALLAVLPPHRRAWVVVALYTGARDSEVDSIEWPDIDWRGRTVAIRGTKTDGARRELPLQPVLASVLERFKGTRGPVVGEWLNVRRDLHAACERAKIAPCSPNDLRRTFATWLANSGVSEMAVARMLGHGSSQMVRRVYAKIESGLLQREILKLSGSCSTGVPRIGTGRAARPVVSEASLGQLAELLTTRVLGDRIELSTRGFSGRVHHNPHAGLRRKISPCTTGVPAKRIA